jgi:hypothetical protein
LDGGKVLVALSIKTLAVLKILLMKLRATLMHLMMFGSIKLNKRLDIKGITGI